MTVSSIAVAVALPASAAAMFNVLNEKTVRVWVQEYNEYTVEMSLSLSLKREIPQSVSPEETGRHLYL